MSDQKYISITDWAISETIDGGYFTIIILEPRIIRNHVQEIDLVRFIANIVNQNTNIVIFEYCSAEKIKERIFTQNSTKQVRYLEELLNEREIKHHGQIFIKFMAQGDYTEKLNQSEKIINFIYYKIATLVTNGAMNIYEETVQFCQSIM